MVGLRFVLAVLTAIQSPLPSVGLAKEPLRVGVRGGVSEDGEVEVDLQNVSSATVEGPAEISFVMSPVDRTAPPLFGGMLQSSAEAVTGKFGGYYAARMKYPPFPKLATLRLEPGDKRTVRIGLLELRWSLSPQWTEEPREFWELAATGEYRLETMLSLNDDHGVTARARPVKVKIRLARQ